MSAFTQNAHFAHGENRSRLKFHANILTLFGGQKKLEIDAFVLSKHDHKPQSNARFKGLH